MLACLSDKALYYRDTVNLHHLSYESCYEHDAHGRQQVTSKLCNAFPFGEVHTLGGV